MFESCETLTVSAVDSVRVVLRIVHEDADEHVEVGSFRRADLDGLVESLCLWGVGLGAETAVFGRGDISGEYAVVDGEFFFEITLDREPPESESELTDQRSGEGS